MILAEHIQTLQAQWGSRLRTEEPLAAHTSLGIGGPATAFIGVETIEQLASVLTTTQKLGCDTLIIGGLTTSGCVRATAVDAIQHGFVPVVVRDAVGDRDPSPHEANLFDLENKYADVMTSSEVAAAISQRPGVDPADD